MFVKGKHGELEKNFKHVAVNIKVVTIKGVKKVVIEMRLGNYRNKPVIKSICSAIQNMIDGATKSHCYKIRWRQPMSNASSNDLSKRRRGRY